MHLLLILPLAALLLYWLWLLIPILAGLPYLPTQAKRIRRALALAGVQPGETVYDLGAGDGRVLFIAVEEFQARAVGIEISPLHCLAMLVKARLRGMSDRISVHWCSFYRADLSAADVVFVYLTSKQAARLHSRLEEQLRPGARVVSVSCAFEGWQPAAVDEQELLFLYRIKNEYHQGAKTPSC